MADGIDFEMDDAVVLQQLGHAWLRASRDGSAQAARDFRELVFFHAAALLRMATEAEARIDAADAARVASEGRIFNAAELIDDVLGGTDEDWYVDIGVFETPEEAAKAQIRAVLKAYGVGVPDA